MADRVSSCRCKWRSTRTAEAVLRFVLGSALGAKLPRMCGICQLRTLPTKDGNLRRIIILYTGHASGKFARVCVSDCAHPPGNNDTLAEPASPVSRECDGAPRTISTSPSAWVPAPDKEVRTSAT